MGLFDKFKKFDKFGYDNDGMIVMDMTKKSITKRVTTKLGMTQTDTTKRVTTKMGMIIVVFILMEFTLIQK